MIKQTIVKQEAIAKVEKDLAGLITTLDSDDIFQNIILVDEKYNRIKTELAHALVRKDELALRKKQEFIDN